ncbi:unnamed protein product [Cyclocybe aegerita]|uniref:Uncharacterized protein n=1 Tax=Cyclocybe aegerita TaxID=1973307 RepID=A0A8S0VZS2_CYCAE|nr:unnamed protein product [Cyclocybe aegerita]
MENGWWKWRVNSASYLILSRTSFHPIHPSLLYIPVTLLPSYLIFFLSDLGISFCCTFDLHICIFISHSSFNTPHSTFVYSIGGHGSSPIVPIIYLCNPVMTMN